MQLHEWRYKRYHLSYLFAWISAGLLVGTYAGHFFELRFMWPFIVILLFLLGISLRSRRWYACVIIVVVGTCFGMLRGSDFDQQLRRLDAYIGRKITLTGTISQDPVLKNGSTLWQTQLSRISVAEDSYAGEVYATVVSDEVLKRGDVVTVFGNMQTGFGSFRLTTYRAELKHVLRPNDPFLNARDTFSDATKRVVPEPEASLGLGFLVGQKSSLPNDLSEQLKTVGLTHIIVASGYNLTILVRFARRLLSRRSRYLALAGSLALVVGFVLTSGFSPSMNRAAVVTVLSLVAWYYGRKFHPVNLILYVAAASALWYPPYVWSDIGWLLSFMAFTGVLVVAPMLTQLLYKKDKEPSAFMRLIVETLSAELMTLPVIIAVFGYVPLLALVANMLVAPVIPFAMLATFAAGLVGLTTPVLAVLAVPASIVIAFVVAIVEFLARPEWARFAVQLHPGWFVLWYAALFAGAFWLWHRRRVDLTETSVVE